MKKIRFNGQILLAVFGVTVGLVAFQNCGIQNGRSHVSLSSLNANQAPPAGENLFPLGSFDNVSDYSVISASGTPDAEPAVFLAAESAYAGAMGLHLTGTEFFSIERQSFPDLDKNKRYRFSFWARRLVAAPDVRNTPSLMLYSGDRLASWSGYLLMANMVIASSEWTEYKTEFQPIGDSLRFDFYIHTGQGNVVDIDEIRLEEVK